jgi:O-acetyl-ADP-ribose deacetylase (regulator of RNase III)
MKSINYITGDLLSDNELNKYEGKLILHVCNNKGGWGSGFVVSLSNKWKEPEKEYRKLKEYKLGFSQFIFINSNTIVINMIAQNGYGNSKKTGIVYLQYDALEKCLNQIGKFTTEIIKTDKPSILMPRIGCGLAGGSWIEVEKIIEKTLCSLDLNIFVYSL